MKIAAITDNGLTISQHFGRAGFYLVVTIEQGQIVQRELRPKLGHSQFSSEPHEPHTPDEHSAEGGGHGFGPAAHERHTRMAETIHDCEALLCRGMGAGAYQSMLAAGIRPLVTDLESIDEAVQAYSRGDLVDHTGRLH